MCKNYTVAAATSPLLLKSYIISFPFCFILTLPREGCLKNLGTYISISFHIFIFNFLSLWWFKHVKRIKDLVVMWKADCLKEKWNMKLWNKKEIQTFDKMRKTENLKKYSWQRWSKRLFFCEFQEKFVRRI